MRRGTTPALILKVHTDLTGKTVYVTISQDNGHRQFTVAGDALSVQPGPELSVIALWLTQEQTLKLRCGEAEIHVRYIDENGVADATVIKTINIDRTLLERVIKYDSSGT